uniref:Capping protein inhibiting regulator of actin dynamics n=1 Tax=Catagonus wagneri TaxID=51154 RepID=A0A8C3WPR8_9CETA
MGARALSQDSVFIPDGEADSEHTVQAMSQDSILGKVKTLQRQLGKNLKLGQPAPGAIPMKKADSGEARLEEQPFLACPAEGGPEQALVPEDTGNKPSETPGSPGPLNLPAARSEMEEKAAPVKPSRPKRHLSSAGTIESVNLDAVPLATARLDNSAAKHRLSVKPKNQRVSRKHRRLARQAERGGLPRQLSLEQNGHPGEDKPIWHEEEPEALDSEEEKRRQDEYWRELEAKCKRQKAEAAEKRRLEEQRLQALERRLWGESSGHERAEDEGDRGPEPEAETGPRAEGTPSPAQPGGPGPERAQPPEELEARGPHEAEEPRREDEEGALEAVRRAEQLGARRRREAEAEAAAAEAVQAEAQWKEEPKKREDLEAQRGQEAEKKLPEALVAEEDSQPLLGPRRGLRSPVQSDFAEKAEREHSNLEEPRGSPQEAGTGPKQSQEAAERGAVPGDERGGRGEERADAQAQAPQKEEAPAEAAPAPGEGKGAEAPETGRKVEELRWQELEERQAAPRPYTFQVASGGRHILFPKVNLSPVTPVTEAGLSSAPQEPKAPGAGPAPHALPSALSVPHTAILVTGAQLCGPAVNLSQIKDTACKSLLGLSEEKKHADGPAPESAPRAPGDPRAGGGKARPAQEAAGGVGALAEWASIRSRILKGVESEQARPGEEHGPRGRGDARGNPRRTPPVSAKFSIKPAWQKFSDGGAEPSRQNTEAESTRRRSVPGPSEEAAPQPPAADPKKPGALQEPTDATEGCKFAKDLPSFLVPSLPSPPQRAAAPAEPPWDGDTAGGVAKPGPVTPGGEEKASPFGIKLRRTNYSLRFHFDQQAEQKKKRHSSSGDSVAAAPPAPGSARLEDTAAEVRKPGAAPAPRKDSAQSPAAPAPGPPAPEHDRGAGRAPSAQKPALAPKPVGQTPPASPLFKLSRPYLVELLARRAGRPDPEPSEPAKQAGGSGDPRAHSPPPPEDRREREKDGEAEGKAASPAPTATRQDKPSPTPEAARKEKPVLQSRHSLDGSKLAEKAEGTPPLWVTLALQKQKGFREQQATREERRPAREASRATRLCSENVSAGPQPGSGGSGRAGPLHKPGAQPEERRPETAAARLERREQLKKASTLPSSVTVEISDPAPPALVKEVTKRFSTPDAAPASTEPAWLALAKRKAKAWSDCPQIIK